MLRIPSGVYLFPFKGHVSRCSDNWLVLVQTSSSLPTQGSTLSFFHDLGIVINMDKSDLKSKQKIKYLSMLIDRKGISYRHLHQQGWGEGGGVVQYCS